MEGLGKFKPRCPGRVDIDTLWDVWKRGEDIFNFLSVGGMRSFLE